MSVSTAAAPGSEVFSFRKGAIAEFAQYVDQDAGSAYRFEKTATLLSVVGPLISIRTTDMCDCGGAHPSMAATFTTLDLRQPVDGEVRVVALSDVFPAADILHALLADAVVHKALGAQTDGEPHSLAALLEVLADRSVEINACSYQFPGDLLNRFAMHHLEGSQVAIRLALPHRDESCRGSIAQLGILLPIPEPLRQDLLAARAQSQGFLMRDAPAIARSRQTSVLLYSE